MSRHEYEVSRTLSEADHPFYALIMAAMRSADSDNVLWLKAGFPDVWDELQARYYAPGGILPTDPDVAVPPERGGFCF